MLPLNDLFLPRSVLLFMIMICELLLIAALVESFV